MASSIEKQVDVLLAGTSQRPQSTRTCQAETNRVPRQAQGAGTSVGSTYMAESRGTVHPNASLDFRHRIIGGFFSCVATSIGARRLCSWHSSILGLARAGRAQCRAWKLTPPSSGRRKGRCAPFAPPLMSNVRPHEARSPHRCRDRSSGAGPELRGARELARAPTSFSRQLAKLEAAFAGLIL